MNPKTPKKAQSAKNQGHQLHDRGQGQGITHLEKVDPRGATAIQSETHLQVHVDIDPEVHANIDQGARIAINLNKPMPEIKSKNAATLIVTEQSVLSRT